MIASPSVSTNSPSSTSLHNAFLALLPKIETHASIAFRHIRCPATRADKIAETIALAWKWFVRLHERGKDINEFMMPFVVLVARAVKSGRRIAGMERPKDLLSERAQRQHGFKVEALPTSPRASYEARYSKPHGQQDYDAFEERLRDNAVTPPPDAAAFRIDFPQWRLSRSDRDRRLIDVLPRSIPISHRGVPPSSDLVTSAFEKFEEILRAGELAVHFRQAAEREHGTYNQTRPVSTGELAGA
jgi:hypothetical protein